MSGKIMGVIFELVLAVRSEYVFMEYELCYY